MPLEQASRPACTIYYNYQRTARKLPQQHGIEGFGGGGEAGERHALRPMEPPQQLLEGRMASRALKQISYCRMNHLRVKSVSTIPVVE